MLVYWSVRDPTLDDARHPNDHPTILHEAFAKVAAQCLPEILALIAEMVPLEIGSLSHLYLEPETSIYK